MRIGYIGFGEASYEMACGLKQEGLINIYAYDVKQDDKVYGLQINDRIKKSKVTKTDSYESLIEKVNIVFVAVPASNAYEVSENIKEIVKKDMLYVDLSASSPDNKKRIFENLVGTGVGFVDAAMLGALTIYKHKVPIIASGCGAKRFCDEMSKFGMNIKVTSNNPGDASAIKLIRSIYIKGTASLLFETLEAAYHFGVAQQVIDSIAYTMEDTSFSETINRLVTGTSVHAQRRYTELCDATKMLNNAGIQSDMSDASIKKHKRLIEMNLDSVFQGRVPRNWKDVIAFITKNEKKSSY